MSPEGSPNRTLALGGMKPARKKEEKESSLIDYISKVFAQCERDVQSSTGCIRDRLGWAAETLAEHVFSQHQTLQLGLYGVRLDGTTEVYHECGHSQKSVMTSIRCMGADRPLPRRPPQWKTYGQPKDKARKEKKKPPEWLSREAEDAPHWLPEGWKWCKVQRTFGSSAGTYDKYFRAPNGKFVRSKHEVLKFDPSKPHNTPSSVNDDDPDRDRGTQQEKWPPQGEGGQGGEHEEEEEEEEGKRQKDAEQEVKESDEGKHGADAAKGGGCGGASTSPSVVDITSHNQYSIAHNGFQQALYKLVKEMAGLYALIDDVFPTQKIRNLYFGYLRLPVAITPEPLACPGSPNIDSSMMVLGFIDRHSMAIPPFMAEYVVTTPATGDFHAAYPSHASPEKSRADYLYSVLTDSVLKEKVAAIVKVRAAKEVYACLYVPKSEERRPRLLLGVFPEQYIVGWLGEFGKLYPIKLEHDTMQPPPMAAAAAVGGGGRVIEPTPPKKEKKKKKDGSTASSRSSSSSNGERKRRAAVKMERSVSEGSSSPPPLRKSASLPPSSRTTSFSAPPSSSSAEAAASSALDILGAAAERAAEEAKKTNDEGSAAMSEEEEEEEEEGDDDEDNNTDSARTRNKDNDDDEDGISNKESRHAVKAEGDKDKEEGDKKEQNDDDEGGKEGQHQHARKTSKSKAQKPSMMPPSSSSSSLPSDRPSNLPNSILTAARRGRPQATRAGTPRNTCPSKVVREGDSSSSSSGALKEECKWLLKGATLLFYPNLTDEVQTVMQEVGITMEDLTTGGD
eukprot:jgi/Bigna1/74972/fgenesh1_pg.32_\